MAESKRGIKIVMRGGTCDYGVEDDYVDRLRGEFPEVDFVKVRSEEEALSEIGDAEAYCGWWPSPKVFRAGHNLKWMHAPFTGVDGMLKLPELIESDVAVTNCRGPHADPMADHVMATVVILTHHLQHMWEDQRARRWDGEKYHFKQSEIRGKTMGIWGLGDLGRAIARRAHAAGMTVYGVDLHSVAPLPEVQAIWGPDRLDELLQISDWFVVATPLTRQTRGLIAKDKIRLLKKGSYLVVISRGGIVDEDALAEALRTGHLAGASVDAFAVEPLPAESPLWDCENLIISPHASAHTLELSKGRHAIFRKNLRRYLANQPFLYVVDKRAGY